MKNAKGGRVRAGARFALPAGRSWTGWKAASAAVVAEFEDGTAAVFTNRVGEGLIASFALDAATAAQVFPAVVRDVLDAALAVTGARRAVDVLGTTENVDLASCVIAGGVRAAVVNHGSAAIDILLVPLGKGLGAGSWTDLVTGENPAGRPTARSPSPFPPGATSVGSTGPTEAAGDSPLLAEYLGPLRPVLVVRDEPVLFQAFELPEPGVEVRSGVRRFGGAVSVSISTTPLRLLRKKT